MTANKHLKQLIRARMARTGESYTAARRHVVAQPSSVALTLAYTIEAHGRHGQTVSFSADGKLLVSGGQDTAVRCWNAADGGAAFALEGHDKVVNDVLLLDGDTAVSASSDRTVRVWDIGTRAARLRLDGHRDAVTALAGVPGRHIVVSGGYDGRLRWWDVDSGECLHEVRTALRRIADLAAVPSTGHVLTSGSSGEIVVHDLRTGDEAGRIDTGSAGVVGLAVSPDGDVVAAAGYEGTVTLWAAPDWDPLRRVDVGARASAVEISADGRLLAAAWDHHVGVWTLDAGAPAVTEKLAIKGVYAVAFSPDGSLLAQTGADGRVTCWRVR
jgi:WD40 repeat protein